ncbi:MAG: PT domain-containing protein [Oscillospiraceae bacterium]|nr:PT domain-containing protein [Oscillospiraceae bacterium]
MKRRIAVLLTIALLLSLSACGDDPGVGDPPLLFTKPTAEEDPTEPSNIVPTQVPTVAPTAAPTQEPTQAPTAIPTEPPTEEPTAEPLDIEALNAYIHSTPFRDQGFMQAGIVRLDPDDEDPYPGIKVDMSALVEGYTYFYDGDKNFYLISDKPLLGRKVTYEHVYFAVDDHAEGARTVYRTDLHGNGLTEVYKSGYGEITGIEYFGTDANGTLFILESDNRIVAYDIATKETTVILEAYYVDYFILEFSSHQYTEKEEGPLLTFSGQLAEDAPKYTRYVFFLNSSKMLMYDDALGNWVQIRP